MREPWKFKPQYPTFKDMQAAHSGARHIQLMPAAGLYLTRGGGVAVPETAQRLADAINAAGISSDCTADEAQAVIAKLLEQPK